MSNVAPRRAITLKLALLALFTGAGLFLSPNLVQRAYAFTEDRCTVTCANGSCSGTGNCTCTCSFWTNTAVCTCAGDEESTAPDSTVSN